MIITSGGVYRVLAPLTTIEGALSADGWSVVVVPPSASTAAFYAGLAAAARLPAYFGANLDALWDSVTDLRAPTAYVLPSWTRLARAEPHDWPRILETLRERTELVPAFAVVLA